MAATPEGELQQEWFRVDYTYMPVACSLLCAAWQGLLDAAFGKLMLHCRAREHLEQQQQQRTGAL